MKTKIFTTRQLAAGICLAMLTASAQDKLKAPIPVHPIPSAPKKSYTPASVLALPDLQCKVYPTGGNASAGISVATNDDGYARFHAVRASAGDKVKQLTMDCTDSAGKFSVYTVDLTSEETFAARPLNIANERGVDRPALKGDPLSYTQEELLTGGYGIRPDPKDNPAAYARWLATASVHGRMLAAKGPSRPKAKSAFAPPSGISNLAPKGVGGPHADNTVISSPGNLWTGSILTGSPNYTWTEAVFNVPTPIPGGDETAGTWVSIWNGLGGNGSYGLIQGGIFIQTSATAASYTSFREYCCGDGASNSYTGNFAPNPGDKIYTQEWYCDASGNINLNGGYGCSFIVDLRNNVFLSCTSATGSPCPSVPALTLCSVNPAAPNCMVLGQSAEFVLENDSPQLTPPTTAFPDLADVLEIDGSALSSATGTLLTITDDPRVVLNTDFTDNGSNLNVWLGNVDQTYFAISQWVRVPGTALGGFITCPWVAADCYPQSIAVGRNLNRSTAGDAWALGNTGKDGDYYIYQWVNGQWVQEPGAGTQIAISPDQSRVWVINHLGQIFYWDGLAFQEAPGHGCATSIGVGPNANGSQYGTPWVIGCGGNITQNSGIYQLQDSTWVQQPGAAVSIAVSPQGVPWVVAGDGSIWYWNGSGFTQVPGCATSIAVGPNTADFAGPNGDVWVTGCDRATSAGNSIYQLQNGSWVQIPGVAAQISLSPDLGIPWVVTFQGQVYR